LLLNTDVFTLNQVEWKNWIIFWHGTLPERWLSSFRWTFIGKKQLKIPGNKKKNPVFD
jgi:hypothetical protein